MKKKFSIWDYFWTLLLIGYIAGGIHLLMVEPFEFPCFWFYLVFLVFLATITFAVVVVSEYSAPTKFFIVEVEKWIKGKYQKIYFVEEQYHKYIFVYRFLYKDEILRTKTDYESNGCYSSTKEEAMTHIIESVQSFIKLTKKEQQQIIKSIKTINEFDMEDLIKELEKNENTNQEGDN